MSIIQFVKFTLPVCSLSYGISPCSASGDAQCYNSYQTCPVKSNFTQQNKIFSFHSANLSHIKFGDSQPLLDGFITPNGTHIYPGVNFGSRQTAEINLLEIQYSGTIFDPYSRKVSDDSLFFARLFKIFNIINKPLTIKTGDFTDGVLTIHSSQNFIIRQVNKTDTGYTITASDILAKLEDIELPNPKLELVGYFDKSNGNALTAGLPVGVWNEEQNGTIETYKVDIQVRGETHTLPSVGGYLRIDEEVFIYESQNDGVFYGMYKPVGGGAAAIIHEQEAPVSYLHHLGKNPNILKEYSDFDLRATPIDMIYSLLLLSSIDPSLIDEESFIHTNSFFDKEQYESFGLAYDMTIKELINELIQTYLLCLYYCERKQKIVIQALTNNFGASIPYIYDEKLYSKLQYTIDMEKQITRITCFYDKYDLVRGYDDPNGYDKSYLYIDAELEHPCNYDVQKQKTIYMRLIPSNPTADTTANVISLAKRFILKDGKGTHRLSFTTSSLELNKISTGDIIEVFSKNFTDASNNQQALMMYIDEIQMLDPANITISGFIYEYGLGKKFFIISPSSFTSSHSDATIEQRRQYGFLDKNYEICKNS